MEQIQSMLKAREKYLLQLKKEKEQALKAAPEGSLRICSRGNRPQYYWRNNPKDFNGVYIREKDRKIAKRLAQKDYDQKILMRAEKELKAIENYLSSCSGTMVEHVYESLHRERQQLIHPIAETTEQYIENWKKVEYQGKEIDETIPELYTAKGERVRSKSEVIIADILNSEGVPYRYEYPLLIRGIGKFYPDFTVLNVSKRKEIYWEHLGMMDDAGYVESALQKIAIYEQNGILPGDNLILTYETKKNPLNQKIVRLMMQQYL